MLQEPQNYKHVGEQIEDLQRRVERLEEIAALLAETAKIKILDPCDITKAEFNGRVKFTRDYR